MSAAASYQASPTRRRRTRAEIQELENALVRIARDHAPLTIRHAFYLAVSEGLVEKTEANYENVVQRLLLRLRRQGRVPYRDVADESRFVRRVETWTSHEEALRATAKFYRRDLLHDQGLHVELWVEKTALLGVLDEVAEEFAVPLYPASGFSSESFAFEAALEIVSARRRGHRVVVLALGDHDPSGVLITQDLERRLRRIAKEIEGQPLEIEFERLALTPAQVRRYKLPTRPTKRAGNSHARGFRSKHSVELDALPPEVLREIVRSAIEREIDPGRLTRTRRIEAAERETLDRLVGQIEASA